MTGKFPGKVPAKLPSHIQSFLVRMGRRGLIPITILIFLVGGLYAIVNFIAYRTLQQEFSLDQERVVEVKEGQGLISVLNHLHSQDLIEDPQSIKLAYYIRGIPEKLQKGRYVIFVGMTVKQLINNIALGKQELYKITVDVGSTFKEFHRKLSDHPHLIHTTAGLSTAKIIKLLKSPYKHPEGLLYADTYFFYAGEQDINILKKAYERLLSTLERHWSTRTKGLLYKNSYDALIMASIIEKETGLDNERPLIAGVFQNRLRIGMRLQTDPTVIYGMGDRYKGNIRRRDLRKKTPYNTYVIYGLPPTPIAMVDERAIQAALHPKPSDYIFFVAKADGTGAHYFSTTLKEHNAAVRRYQLKQ